MAKTSYPPDEPELVADLEELGATFRKRKSGRIHTIDLSGITKVEPVLGRLGGIARLAVLKVGDCELNDAAIGTIPPLPELETLDLSNNPITDASVDALAQHKQLKLLGLIGTEVTASAVKLLRQALLGTRILAVA